MKNFRFILFYLLCTFGYNLMVYGQSLQDIDGNSYAIVKINEQEWSASNLNVSRFRNGDSISQVKSMKDWHRASKEGRPAWCYYNFDKVNGVVYGKLYNWFAVNDERGLAPQGWHVPSNEEWIVLSDYLGGKAEAIKLLNAIDWRRYINGTNDTGFTALPAGNLKLEKEFGPGEVYTAKFGWIGSSASWWTATPAGNLAMTRAISAIPDMQKWPLHKGSGLSVRIIKDSTN